MKNKLSIVKISGMLFLSFLLLGSATSNAQSSSDLSNEAKTEIEALNAEFKKLIEKNDLASIIDMYADDATIVVPGGEKIQGRKAIADYWYALGNIKSISSEVQSIGGNTKVVYELGKWTIVTNNKGVEKTTTSDVVLVWKRMQDYSYKIQLNSLNSSVSTTINNVETLESARK